MPWEPPLKTTGLVHHLFICLDRQPGQATSCYQRHPAAPTLWQELEICNSFFPFKTCSAYLSLNTKTRSRLLHISWELDNPKIDSSYYLLTRQPQILFTLFQVIACNLRLEASNARRTLKAHPCPFESNNALMKSFTCIQTSHIPYRQVWMCSPHVVKMRALCCPGLPRRLFMMTAGQLNLKEGVAFTSAAWHYW